MYDPEEEKENDFMLHNYGESTGQLFYSILLKRKELQYNTFIQNFTPRTHNKSNT
jgi:hypothetical protein